MLYVLVKIFSHPGAKKRNSFKFSTFIGRESVFASELERRVQGVYTERQDDRYGGRVSSKKRETKNGYFENNV